jgi:hypothetical protein
MERIGTPNPNLDFEETSVVVEDTGLRVGQMTVVRKRTRYYRVPVAPNDLAMIEMINTVNSEPVGTIGPGLLMVTDYESDGVTAEMIVALREEGWQVRGTPCSDLGDIYPTADLMRIK